MCVLDPQNLRFHQLVDSYSYSLVIYLFLAIATTLYLLMHEKGALSKGMYD
jgi:hypothetical protein